MSVFDLLKPSPHVAELSDPEEIKKKYKYWRIRTFYGMYVGYFAYYLTRKSFTFAMPALIADLGFTKTQLGFLSSVLALSYGASKFVTGIISDRSNPRYIMGIGLILTGIVNIFFGLSSSLFLFALFWGLNGWFQGWGWPPSAKLLTHWYSKSERGSWWSMWNTAHNLGGAMIPILASGLAQYYGWRYAMYVPGVFCILLGFFVINRLRDTPQSLGLPSIEKFRNDYPSKDHSISDEKVSTKQILFDYVLKNKYIWLLSIAYFFVYLIRQAINDWSQLFLIETKGYSTVVAGTCVGVFEVGGFLGSLASGWSSDWIFKGKRGQINVIFTAFVLLAIWWFWKAPALCALDYVLCFLIGFFIFGPQMLIGIAAAELSHKEAAGTATGFAGWFAYFGAAVAGLPVGKVTKDFGWNGFFIILIICAICALVFLLPLWGKTSREQSVAEKS